MKCAVFLAEGFEECEALITVDMLRRGGILIDMVSITDELTVKSSHNILIQAEKKLCEIAFGDYDVLILPGGKLGTQNLEACDVLKEAVESHCKSGKLTCAICAAPSILGHLGLLQGKRYTCFPTFDEKSFGGEYVQELSVKDGNLITGRGMGATIEFARNILKEFLSDEEMHNVENGIQYEHSFRK